MCVYCKAFKMQLLTELSGRFLELFDLFYQAISNRLSKDLNTQ